MSFFSNLFVLFVLCALCALCILFFCKFIALSVLGQFNGFKTTAGINLKLLNVESSLPDVLGRWARYALRRWNRHIFAGCGKQIIQGVAGELDVLVLVEYEYPLWKVISDLLPGALLLFLIGQLHHEPPMVPFNPIARKNDQQ